ncbi:MAG TPA: hypothetical protein VHD90_19365 [Phototrophicaceae bacterium]|nr:hypothetical protein [Phototrophicaceae bacterium]
MNADEDTLRALIARWEALADKARDQAKITHPSDLARVAFQQAISKTYLSAAQDLRALLDPPSIEPAPTTAYALVADDEAAAVLKQAGLFARSLTLHPDRVFTAVFSRLQPITQESRIRQLTEVDARLVVVDQGTLRDSGDPYIDFAFAADRDFAQP